MQQQMQQYQGTAHVNQHLPGMQDHTRAPHNFQRRTDSGMNPLVTSAMPLLTLMTQIKHTSDHPNVAALRAQVVDEVKMFEQKLVKVDYNLRTIIAARYSLCTALDETVLGRPWGTHSVWVQQSLLSMFHKETWGGERFYIILEEMLRDPRQNIDFLELVYLLLSLGFEGRYFDKGEAIREEIRSRVFYRIRSSRQKVEKQLAPHWKDDKPIAVSQYKRRKIKKLFITTCSIILFVGVVFNYKVYKTSAPTVTALEKVGNESPVTVFSQLLDRSVVIRNRNSNF